MIGIIKKTYYVYNMNGLAIISEQNDLRFPLLGSGNRGECEAICDNFVLPEEKE